MQKQVSLLMNDLRKDQTTVWYQFTVPIPQLQRTCHHVLHIHHYVVEGVVTVLV